MTFLSGRTSLTTVQTADLADNSVTLAKFAHGTASQNIAYDGSGVPVDVALSTGASDAEKANIMLNAFRISVNGGLTKQNMVDGFVDEFEDETGIDNSTSTSEVYDATSDFYTATGTTYPGAVATASADAKWTGDKANWTFSGDDISGGVGGGSAIYWNTLLSGDFEINFTSQATAVSCGFGVITAAVHAASWNANNTDGGFAIAGDIWRHHDGNAGDDWMEGTTKVYDGEITNGATFKIERVSGEIKIYDAGALVHTFATTSTADMYFYAGADTTNGINFDNFSITSTSATGGDALALFSNATTALAVPTDANIVMWEQDVDTITLNTDLKAYASRDGGTTYTQITLAKEATLTTGQILTGTVDISGQPSGTAMKYKITTAADNEVKIHAVALQWS